MSVGGQSHPPAALPPVLIVQEAGWDLCMNAENLAPTGIRSPNRPDRSESLYRLRHPGPCYFLQKNVWTEVTLTTQQHQRVMYIWGGMFHSIWDCTRGPKTGILCSFPTLRAYGCWGAKSLPSRGHPQQARKVRTERKTEPKFDPCNTKTKYHKLLKERKRKFCPAYQVPFKAACKIVVT